MVKFNSKISDFVEGILLIYIKYYNYKKDMKVGTSY